MYLKKKKGISFVLALAMLATMIPMGTIPVFAAEPETVTDSISAWTEVAGNEILLDGEGDYLYLTAPNNLTSASAVKIVVAANDVKIEMDKAYDNVHIEVWEVGTLYLENVNITAPENKAALAILHNSGSNEIIAQGDSVLNGGDSSLDPYAGHAMYIENDNTLTIAGSGTLTLNGGDSRGIFYNLGNVMPEL